jgi:hypothetical protein
MASVVFFRAALFDQRPKLGSHFLASILSREIAAIRGTGVTEYLAAVARITPL